MSSCALRYSAYLVIAIKKSYSYTSTSLHASLCYYADTSKLYRPHRQTIEPHLSVAQVSNHLCPRCFFRLLFPLLKRLDLCLRYTHARWCLQMFRAKEREVHVGDAHIFSNAQQLECEVCAGSTPSVPDASPSR